MKHSFNFHPAGQSLPAGFFLKKRAARQLQPCGVAIGEQPGPADSLLKFILPAAVVFFKRAYLMDARTKDCLQSTPIGHLSPTSPHQTGSFYLLFHLVILSSLYKVQRSRGCHGFNQAVRRCFCVRPRIDPRRPNFHFQHLKNRNSPAHHALQ